MTYALLDSGDGRKLERVGPYLLDRQAPAAIWKPRLPIGEWNRADAVHHRSDKGGGSWEFRTKLPEKWEAVWGGFTFIVKPTPFGHIGLFAEHAARWKSLAQSVSAATVRLGRPPDILNLFAYTGGATMAASRAGASVCHVDAAKGVVDWAREHAARNSLGERPIRWIVDDCSEYLAREARRGRRYDGILFDPPSFGRGSRGEVWKIEDGIHTLLDLCVGVLNPDPAYVLFTCHTPGFTPTVLGELLAERIAGFPGQKTSGEMLIPEKTGRSLPSGSFAEWAQTGD